MRTHRRKPSLHKRVRQGTKRAIRRYQFGGTAEEEYRLGLALIKENKFRDAAVQFQKAIDQGHPSAIHWLEYAQKRSMIPKFIDATEIIEGLKSVADATENKTNDLDPNSNTFYLTYLINQGNSIRATHALLYNKIIEKAKPTLYPPTPSRLQQTKNMLGSLAFWGGAVEQEIYDSALPLDPKKVKQMAEFVIDAAQHSLVSSNQDMLLLISNIANWIERGTTNTNLAKHIVTASKNLTEIHLLTEIQSKREEGQDAKSARINAEAELTSYFMQMESNLVKTLQKWDEIDSYSKLVKNIMGQAAAGGKIVEKVIKGIKTKRFVGGDVRAEILASIPNTAQCNTGMIDSKKDKCYLCGLRLDDYRPNGLHRESTGKGKAKADCGDKEKSLCPPNAIDCEHVLGIQLALSHLNLVHTGDREYQKTTSNVYKEVINTEYDWSHKCCNMMKLDRSFIRKMIEGENTGFYEPDTHAITSVLASIEEQYDLNRKGQGYAYGCGCIGNGMSYLVRNQLGNVVARVKKVTDMINLQIMGIDAHLQKQNEYAGLQGTEIEQYRRASEVYDSFIKFRFLSRITKNNWIKALTNNFIHGSIAPGNADEIEGNGEMEGGVRFGVDDHSDLENFVKLVNEQSSYDIGSIQLMSDDTIVDNIRDIVKDTCDLDNAGKKLKLKELKRIINGKPPYGEFLIKTDRGYTRYQIRDIAVETVRGLTSHNVQNSLSEFIKGTIPLELDKPITIKQDQSAAAYIESCKSGIAQMKASEASTIAQERLHAKGIENKESAGREEKARTDAKDRIDSYIKDNIDNIALHIAGRMGENLGRDGYNTEFNDALERGVHNNLSSGFASSIINRFPPQDFYTAADLEQKISQKLKEDKGGQYSNRYTKLHNFGSSVRSRMGNGGMTYDGARKRVIAQMAIDDMTRYGAISSFVKSLNADAEEITQQFIDKVKRYEQAGIERQIYTEEVAKIKKQDAENDKYRQPPIDPSRLRSLLVQAPLRRNPPPPQLPSQVLQQELPLVLPQKITKTNFSSALHQPTLYEQQETQRIAAEKAAIQASIALGKAQRSASNQSWAEQEHGRMQELQQQQQIREKVRKPSINTVRKYTNAYDPRSNAFGSTFRSLILPSATPHNPVPQSISSEVVPPGALPVYLQNRGSTYVPYQPRGRQPTPIPQSSINARTAARAAHAPVLAQQRQQTHDNIISGRVPAPAGSTRSQTSARAAQQAAIAPAYVQPTIKPIIVNAPPNNMNNTATLWKNLGGRHSHRRKTNKKRSKSRRSFKK